MDKIVTKLLPLMKIAAVIGALCGLIIIGLGIARMYDLIDMGKDSERIEPLWMIGGGAALIVTFVFKFQSYKKKAAAAKERLG